MRFDLAPTSSRLVRRTATSAAAVRADASIDPATPHQLSEWTSERAPPLGTLSAVARGGVAGPVHLARVEGCTADVLLPATGGDASATFVAYLDALERSGVFAAQASELSTLRTLEVVSGEAHDKGRPRVGIVLSEALMMLPGAHPRTDYLIELVVAMGCRPVLIPPCADLAVRGGPAGRAQALVSLASSLDGLLGPGGADVDPRIYGEENTSSVNTNFVRDTFEAAFVKVALKCELFALGICRSHQLWNAAAGGSLFQDLRADGQALHSHDQRDYGIPFAEPLIVRNAHGDVVFADVMEVAPGSRLAALVGDEPLPVNSVHHQAVREVGRGFRVVGVAPQETGAETIEATEHVEGNAITVQFHPEWMGDLFSTLGRRAHVFELLKNLRKRGCAHLLLEQMRADGRFRASDLEWVKKDFAKLLRSGIGFAHEGIPAPAKPGRLSGGIALAEPTASHPGVGREMTRSLSTSPDRGASSMNG